MTEKQEQLDKTIIEDLTRIYYQYAPMLRVWKENKYFKMGSMSFHAYFDRKIGSEITKLIGKTL